MSIFVTQNNTKQSALFVGAHFWLSEAIDRGRSELRPHAVNMANAYTVVSP